MRLVSDFDTDVNEDDNQSENTVFQCKHIILLHLAVILLFH